MSLTGIQIIGEIQGSEVCQKGFNRYLNFVGNLYFTALPKINIQYLKKIVIELVDSNESNEIIIPYSKDLPVCIIQCGFDFCSLLKKDSLTKKRDLIEFLHQRILRLSKEFGWNLIPFVSAYEKVKESNYEIQTIIGKVKSSKDRKHKAGIGVEQDIDSASIFILFFDANEKVLDKIKVFDTLPQPFLYMQLIGKFKWLNNSDFALYNKSEEIRIVASVTNNNLSVIYTPKDREIDGIKEELKFIAKENILPSWFD